MSLKISVLVRQFFDKYFWRQHPETALRYLPVVGVIKRINLVDTKILEIGSGSLGIIPYLKRSIDGIDNDFSGPKTDLLSKIKGDARSLPFKRGSYDVVISVDVLEHLPSIDRSKAILEQLRVAKKLAVIVVPCGEFSQKQDLDLHNYWLNVFKTENKFLKEHVTYGLPKVEEILVEIDKSLRKLKKMGKVASEPLLNLGVRNVLMKTWISKNKLLYYFYMKGFLLLLPILRIANFGNCYRRMFVIEFSS